MLRAFFDKAKTFDFMNFRVKLFYPKISPLFLSFVFGGGDEKMQFDPLFQEKSLQKYLSGYSVQNLPGKIS